YDIGCQFLPQTSDGHTCTVFPSRAALVSALHTGRPGVMSTRSAQVTLTNLFAARSLPVARSITYRNPLRLACITTLRGLPSMVSSACAHSLTPSQSKGSLGVI